jgi:hypothetical protein
MPAVAIEVAINYGQVPVASTTAHSQRRQQQARSGRCFVVGSVVGNGFVNMPRPVFASFPLSLAVLVLVQRFPANLAVRRSPRLPTFYAHGLLSFSASV